MKEILLSEHEKPTLRHYEIPLMSWAGWVFDFYDLILYTFLFIPTAAGGAAFGVLSDRFGRRRIFSGHGDRTRNDHRIVGGYSVIPSSYPRLHVSRRVWDRDVQRLRPPLLGGLYHGNKEYRHGLSF